MDDASQGFQQPLGLSTINKAGWWLRYDSVSEETSAGDRISFAAQEQKQVSMGKKSSLPLAPNQIRLDVCVRVTMQS